MQRIFVAVLALMSAFLAQIATADARVQVRIDLSSQRMYVQSSSGSYVWPVSTARAGYTTPRGSYAPTSLQRMHYSRKYHMSPMPHSIFFRGGYAIHGTYATGALGRPASHGCVRLAPGNAANLFKMVQREGASISISGSAPGGRMYARSHAKQYKHYAARRHTAKSMAYAPTYRARHHDSARSLRSWQRDPMRYY